MNKTASFLIGIFVCINAQLVQAELYSSNGYRPRIPIEIRHLPLIGREDTVVDFLSFDINDTINKGLIFSDASFYVYSTFDNYGFLIASVFSIEGGQGDGTNSKVVNHESGNIIIGLWTDMYSNESIFENAGKVSYVNLGGDNYVPNHVPDAFLLLRGVIKNTGTFLVDRKANENVCHQAGNASVNIINDGLFEIGKGTICTFMSDSTHGIVEFVQNSGTLKVDGEFSASSIAIHKGVITGNGAITGFAAYALNDKTLITPGGVSIGSLSLSPNDNGFIFCDLCSIDIDIAGIEATKIDHLAIVDDNFYALRLNLNVHLRDGFIPQQGDSFNIISANTIYSAQIYPNLPELPGGLNWDVQNNGTNIILTVY